MNDAAGKLVIRFDRGTLVLEGMTRDAAAATLAGGYWTWDARAGVLRCDALHYDDAVRALHDAVPSPAGAAAPWPEVIWPRVQLPPLREDQAAALDAWMRTRRGVVVMPTGTGKTEVALRIMHALSVPTLVVAPVRDLMYQWHQRIADRLGYDAGIIGDNIFNKRPVSVTTYDSACIHMQEFGGEFALLVFDECHHLPGPVRADAARMSIAPWRLGLTATPERSDGRETVLDELIGPVVHRYTLAAARGRVLAEYDVVRIPVYLAPGEQAQYNECSFLIRHHMAERRKAAPGFTAIDLHKESGASPESRKVIQALRIKQSIEDRAREKLRVLEDLFRLHHGTRTLVFTGTNVMAREVSVRFLVPCLLHHCRKKERKDILDGLRQGVYPAIVANQVLDEGVDIPEAKVAVVLGGLASVKQAKQRLGRILRKTGAERAILYEVVCAETREAMRSRQRRRSDAYEGTRHIRL
ncbi:DEAD/DEAH box helicase [bacterium]|nr:DEAD/DEAH box helicase [bacterium]